MYTAHMGIDLAAIEGAIASFAADASLVAAYLHGSAAVGRMDSESDIDIALLPRPELSAEERWNLRLRCLGFLMQRFPAIEEKFDVIVLQDVPVLLRFNVIRNCIVLHECDRSERILYELHVEQAYDDERYYLDREAHATVHRILSRPAA